MAIAVQYGPGPADVALVARKGALMRKLNDLKSHLTRSKAKVSFGHDEDDFEAGDDRIKAVKKGADGQAMTALPKGPAQGDKMLARAMQVERFMGNRKWAMPSKMEATMTVFGGAGRIFVDAVNLAVGSKPLVKEVIQISTSRWNRFASATQATLLAEKIPALGMVIAPITQGVASKAEGKGNVAAAKDAALLLGASAIDRTLTALTGGAYGVATEVTAQGILVPITL